MGEELNILVHSVGLLIGEPARDEDGLMFALRRAGHIQVAIQQVGPETIAKIPRIFGIGFSAGPVDITFEGDGNDGTLLLIDVTPKNLGIETHNNVLEAYKAFCNRQIDDDLGTKPPKLAVPSTQQIVEMAKKLRSES